MIDILLFIVGLFALYMVGWLIYQCAATFCEKPKYYAANILWAVLLAIPGLLFVFIIVLASPFIRIFRKDPQWLAKFFGEKLDQYSPEYIKERPASNNAHYTPDWK